MKKTKLIASVKTYDLFGNTSITHFPVYVDKNERLFVKVMGDYISVFHPDMLKNDVKILQNI